MSEKTKLYVFEKKEIALIFVFMLLIAMTAFMLGVKIGKSYSYDAAGYTDEDREKIELLSTQEEMIRQMLDEQDMDEIDQDELNREMHEALQERIRQQLDRSDRPDSSEARPSGEREDLLEQQVESPDIIGDYEQRQRRSDLVHRELPQEDESDTVAQRQASLFSGKFTIQLGSYRSQKDAEDFAKGFAVRGYDPIINEVDIPGRGTWYRVSLGVFENSTQAKSYIENEKELFQGQDYVIGRFD